jgi:hypothetical protein
VKLSGWPLGVNNVDADANLDVLGPRGIIRALRDAVNVDVISDGKLRLRPGITQVKAEPECHSLFSTDRHMVWVSGDELRVADTELDTATVLTDDRLDTPISCVNVNGDIYFSNELINGIIRRDGIYEPWGLEVPVSAPTLVPSSGGPNVYLVTCTFVTDSGEESGAPRATRVTAGDTPSFTLYGIPQPTDPRITGVRIYMTNIDGIELQAVATIPVGQTAWAFYGFLAYGAPLQTQFMEPPPCGQILELHDGIIYIGSGSNVFHTQPLRYGLHDPTADFFMYPERVTLIKSHDGLYIGADQLYFLQAPGTVNVGQDSVMPYKAVEGAVTNLPDSKDFMFMSDRGFVRAAAGGQVTNITEKNVAVDRYERGAMGYTSVGGHRAIIAMFKDPVANKNVAEDFTLDVTSRKQGEL